MKVQAVRTQEYSPFAGIYDNIPRVPGEVFELITPADGKMPLRMKRTYKKAKRLNNGIEESYFTSEYDEEVFLDKEGNPMHADYAPHDETTQGQGNAFGGETFRTGWMRVVPEETPVGLYPENEVIGERAAPVQRLSGTPRPQNAPQATPSRGTMERPVRKAG